MVGLKFVEAERRKKSEEREGDRGDVSERRVRGEGKTWGCNWWLGSVEMIERGEMKRKLWGRGCCEEG